MNLKRNGENEMKNFNKRQNNEKMIKNININIKLMNASHEGNLDIVKELIAEGADVNAKNNSGFTPLMYARYGENLDIVKTLIAAGAKNIINI